MEDSQGILKDEENGGKQPGDGSSKGGKTPRRIIYFTSGEMMEEYSTEEEMEESGQNPLLDTVGLSWASYLRFWVLRIAATTFFTCEFLGGKFAALFGLTEPKYQYAIDEYYRTQRKESESDEDGEEILEMKGTVASNEKEHLERQSIGYGSIDSKDTSAFSPENTIAVVNELEEGSLPVPK